MAPSSVKISMFLWSPTPSLATLASLLTMGLRGPSRAFLPLALRWVVSEPLVPPSLSSLWQLPLLASWCHGALLALTCASMVAMVVLPLHTTLWSGISVTISPALPSLSLFTTLLLSCMRLVVVTSSLVKRTLRSCLDVNTSSASPPSTARVRVSLGMLMWTLPPTGRTSTVLLVPTTPPWLTLAKMSAQVAWTAAVVLLITTTRLERRATECQPILRAALARLCVASPPLISSPVLLRTSLWTF
mmetsp:Transcript_421/g.1010  ORF Transcript_421/g.1010 Transcript_421/m.1010 type:complete len:245 (+) Transcript_421:1248-1982(+)